ncbi:nucleotidyl transferase AbiEii/AbiGii toxin family protein [Chitinophaga horti]|uniref:Nucleotidyl transferase AbiEii/AbiGii toxin family protein n=1 Tax=Chitinophaga horti TaxID=2920382 RepID=A0ABY6J3R1_9BACT|nr:nucleotidyl transferase AbiEii/AbiGii toxin family protein [Chitinophaga horti]UYQ92837.1 nucleotidyl transferase AbiEii/AbiGii toxin family protein [Chitinophaga horti]
MEKEAYKRQVSLLLNVLPEVAKETCFAMHGGTAINLFVRNMPRLSVDIDLTYVLIEDRATTLIHIGEALERIKANIEKAILKVHVSHRKEIGKLLIAEQGVDVKLEANLVARGILSDPVKMQLCEKAQNDFDAFCVIPVVPVGQLYGGKICAALDRQHPRDLFDVKYLMANEGFSEQVKTGFLYCLLCSDRPINEVISPNFQDQHSAMANQFAGMTDEEFNYTEYEEVRAELVKTVKESLTERDKLFLLSFKDVNPDWSIYDFSRFPAIAWKLQNLGRLKAVNPAKHKEQYEALQKILYSL